MSLTERIHVQTLSMEVNNERLDNLRIAVDRHRELLYGHDDGDHPGLLQDMKELKKTERERRLTLRGALVAFVGGLGAMCKLVWDAWHV
jgi:hypothetical protein